MKYTLFISLILFITGHLQAQEDASANQLMPSKPTEFSETTKDLIHNNFDKANYFGSQLFQGLFAKDSFKSFNPEYAIAIGDKVAIKLWGAFDFEQIMTVDEQGNIFIPRVGPVKVVGVTNKDLNRIVKKSVRKVFLKNVDVYTNLSTSQSVKVYVTGFVKQPGLFTGLNSDSLLHYIDKAGGIDEKRGSFIQINILRNQKQIQTANLYDFIVRGSLPTVQFHDGDTILIEPKKNITTITGLVKNEGIFEFASQTLDLKDLLILANRSPEATHVRITRNKNQYKTFEYFSVDKAQGVKVYPEDIIRVVNDRIQGNLSVRIEGMHQGSKEYIVPPGTTIGDILKNVEFGPLSDREHLQLYRQSVKVSQKKRLEESLNALERTILSATSATNEAAAIRATEAKMLLEAIERARKIEPLGQVVLSKGTDFTHVVLEENDIIKIPTKSHLVMINGEVIFPNAMVYNPELDMDDYISSAGGFTDRARDDHILILHLDGSFTIEEGSWFTAEAPIKPGDEIFVLPEVDSKNIQITKDISQILFNIAYSAKQILAF